MWSKVVTFYLVPKLRRSTFHSDVRRAWLAVAERLLHHLQWGAFFYHRGTACAAVDGR